MGSYHIKDSLYDGAKYDLSGFADINYYDFPIFSIYIRPTDDYLSKTRIYATGLNVSDIAWWSGMPVIQVSQIDHPTSRNYNEVIIEDSTFTSLQSMDALAPVFVDTTEVKSL